MKEGFTPREENMIKSDPSLYVMVMVRNKDTGAIGITALYNEAEVDRRIALLEEGLGEKEEYGEVLAELKEFHRVRREAFAKVKDTIEIILPPGK